jgi:hypothetical protein
VAAITWSISLTSSPKRPTRPNGKSWQYVLISHDAVADNMTLRALAERYSG